MSADSPRGALKPVSEAWASYRERVLPADAGPIQVLECRRAFYAGVRALEGALEVISRPEVPEVEGVAYLEAVRREVMQFNKDVKAGRA